MPQPPLRLPSRSSPSASQQARVLPVDDPPTSTATPLRPARRRPPTCPAPRHARAAHTAAGPAAAPAVSSGCTGRCTSSANGSAHLLQQPPRVRRGPAGPRAARSAAAARPPSLASTSCANCSGVGRRRSTATTSSSRPGSTCHRTGPGARTPRPRTARANAARRSSRSSPAAYSVETNTTTSADLPRRQRELLRQVPPPQLHLLISVVEAAHSPRLQRRGDPLHVLPLRPGERQRHIPPPPSPAPGPAPPSPPAMTRVCHRPGTGNTAPARGQDPHPRVPLTDSSAAWPGWSVGRAGSAVSG